MQESIFPSQCPSVVPSITMEPSSKQALVHQCLKWINFKTYSE